MKRAIIIICAALFALLAVPAKTAAVQASNPYDIGNDALGPLSPGNSYVFGVGGGAADYRSGSRRFGHSRPYRLDRDRFRRYDHGRFDRFDRYPDPRWDRWDRYDYRYYGKPYRGYPLDCSGVRLNRNYCRGYRW